MDNGIYSIPSYFPYSQGNKWTYIHKRGDEVSEVNYLIEGTESFNGVEVPKRVQLENTEEYFCTLVEPVYGISDYKHHIGMAPEYLIYTPPANVIPAKMRVGDIHYNTSHLFRFNSDGTLKDEGSFYDTTVFQAVESVTVPAGTFDQCLKLILTRDDVFSDMVIKVNLTEWVAEGVGIVKSIAKVIIYSPEGGEPFIVGADDELRHAAIGKQSY